VPKLLIFAPCEKVIIDQDKNVSLIAVLQSIQIQLLPLPPDEQIPEGVAAPLRWSAIAVWLRELGDDGKRYEQSVELFGPAGTTLAKALASFAFERPVHSQISSFLGFPLVVARGGADYTLKLYLREEAEGAESREVASYPLSVEISSPPKPE
jgi:hypothetical protein